MIYAKKGEPITCENGHEICRIALDLEVGHPPSEGDTTLWLQPEPEGGKPIPNCATCGAPFAVGMGMTLHFEDGWRSVESLRKGMLIQFSEPALMEGTATESVPDETRPPDAA